MSIAAEAEKGYDLMIIGLEKTSHRGKDFHESVTRLAQASRDRWRSPPCAAIYREKPGGKLSILVPVNGTEPSRRAAEVAITMARATKAPLTVLYVAVRAPARTACAAACARAATKKLSSRISSRSPTATT